MIKNKLFDDVDSEDEVILKTENEYAKRYDTWREKEELHKLEQKYGDKPLNSDVSVSSDSEDDDEPPEISEEIEQQFLKTLALLKTKDPRIYDTKYEFFQEVAESKQENKTNIEEPSKPKKEADSLAAAFADSDDDDNDGEIFKVEKKVPELQPKKVDTNPTKLKEYLTGQTEAVEPQLARDLAPLRALWADPALGPGEAFLRDYILNRRYLESGEPLSEQARDDAALETDEQLVEEQGQFERAYNFRFEEPDHEYLKRYPRTMNYIRPKDDRRSKKRAEVRSRKEEEKQRKMEEIARLKALKLKEIQEKIAKIKEVTGNEELAFKDEDIEGDFDPDEHDRRMRAIFDEQYYGQEDETKPVFPDLDEELEIENWENFEDTCDDPGPGDNEEPHCEDEDFNMDADYNPNRARTTLMEEIKETLGKKRRNRKKKSKLAEILTKPKPKFIPNADKTYQEYMEEYYKMDCEDVIAGDLPTRFKYRETVANDFGLTVEEILLADDKELNRWASLKKAVRYRPAHVEKSEVTTYAQKAADLQLKRKMLPNLFTELPEEPEIVVSVETKKEKKKKRKSKDKTNDRNEATHDDTDGNLCNKVEESNPAVSINHEIGSSKEEKSKKKDTTKQTPNNLKEEIPNIADGNATAEIASSNRKKNKYVKSKAENTTVDIENNLENIENTMEDHVDVKTNKKERKKKNKHKQDVFVIETVELQAPSNSVSQQNGQTHLKHTPNINNNNVNGLKRKLEENNSKDNKSKKKKRNVNTHNNNIKQDSKNKSKHKKKFNNSTNVNKKTPENPLSKLSDERLKAYGLNPKKYRSFLKYKKY